MRPGDLELDAVNLAFLAQHPSRHPRLNIDVLAAQAAKGEGTQARKIRTRFFVSPVEILGTERVEGLRVELNRLVDDGKGGFSARGTGVFEEIPAQLVFRSVGYKGHALSGLPFDDRNGTIPNRDGRVIDPLTDAPCRASMWRAGSSAGPPA